VKLKEKNDWRRFFFQVSGREGPGNEGVAKVGVPSSEKGKLNSGGKRLFVKE